MNSVLNKEKFGPWALITGASSGLGKEFARQLAGQGFNLILTARRQPLLDGLAGDLVRQFSIQAKVVPVDLADEGFLSKLTSVTDPLDIGLVISNAGLPQPGEYLKTSADELRKGVRVNVLAHLAITRYYGERLVKRGRGGIILVSALGSVKGIPFLANSAATKAFVYSLGQGLHIELGRSGVNVLVMSPGATDTPAMGDLGFKPGDSPMKPMAVAPSIAATLKALKAGKAHIIPGWVNRVMNAVVPASVSRNMFGKMLAKANGIQL
jgi:uncharacterized protein